MGFISFQVIAGLHPTYMIGGYLVGSAVAFIAARNR